MRQAKRKIRQWFERATPEQIAQGLRWYADAHTTAAQLAAQYNLSIESVAGIIAALSPRITWEENVKGASHLLRTGSDRTVAGLRANRQKAKRILRGESPSSVLGGKKVTSFYRNILGDTNTVTVDTWAARAAGLTDERVKLDRKRRYEKIADAYRTLAEVEGLEPRQAQAIVWLAIRAASEGRVAA